LQDGIEIDEVRHAAVMNNSKPESMYSLKYAGVLTYLLAIVGFSSPWTISLSVKWVQNEYLLP
jgi:hypothetical protein